MSHEEPRRPILSPRELEVIELVAQGATNQEIARALHISPNTVKVHLRNIYEKLDVSSRTEATMVAVQQGWITLPGLTVQTVEAEVNVATTEFPLQEDDQASAPLPALSSEPLPSPTAVADTSQRRMPWWSWALGVGIVMLMLLALVLAWQLSQTERPQTVIITAEEVLQRWSQLPPLPAARAASAAATTDRGIIFIGGEDDEGPSPDVWLFSPREGEWRVLSPLPEGLRYAEAAWVGGRIYVPGGETNSTQPTRRLWVYDPATEQWMEGTPLPAPRSRYALTTFEGRIYLFGGWDGQAAQHDVWMYTPGAAEWVEVVRLPEARMFGAAAATREGLFFYGGESPAGEASHSGWRLIPEGERFLLNEASPLPTALARPKAATLAGTLYLFDGQAIWQQNRVEGTWEVRAFPSKIAPRRDAAFVADDVYLYIMGGRTEDTLLADVIRFTALFRTFAPLVPGGQ